MLSQTHYATLTTRLFQILRNMIPDIPKEGVRNLVIELSINSPPKIHVTQLINGINDSSGVRDTEMRTTVEITKVSEDGD